MIIRPGDVLFIGLPLKEFAGSDEWTQQFVASLQDLMDNEVTVQLLCGVTGNFVYRDDEVH